MKKSTFTITLMVFGLFISGKNLQAQSSISYSIGQILAAGSGGVVLADGTIARAEVVTLGSGSPIVSNNGQYNTTQMGGVLNGINNNTITTGTVDDSALTISQYEGSKRVGDFTRISAFPTSVDNGSGSNFGNAIGFRIWFSRPINVQQFLMIDCDGNGLNPNPTNGEWFSCFGYNGITQVTPSAITLSPGTDLTTNTRNVNANWSSLVAGKIPGAASFSTMIFPRTTTNNQSVDPDDVRNQGLFNFSTPVDNVFFLWGIYGIANGGVGSEQNSGVSPLVFSLYTDFGDAPDTYHTSKVNNGASHEIYNYVAGTQNSALTLGSTINFEPTGISNTAANTDTDDGITNVPGFDCGSNTYSVTTSVFNNTGSPANLYAWTDFNQNGTFEPVEMQIIIVPSSTTTQNVVIHWTGIVAGLNCGTSADSYLRLRLTLNDLIDDVLTSIDERSFGGTSGGEVEDYKLTVFPQGSSLPVRLISFTSTAINNKVTLSWMVADEISNKLYEIERSDNGINFTSIDKIVTKTYQAGINNYQSTDLQPSQGLNYYRLKIIDNNGSITYSKIVTQRIEGNNIPAISIKPNPFVNNVNVNIRLQKAAPITVSIIDVMGKTVYKNTIKGNTGVNWINIDRLNNLSSGIYTISVQTNMGTTQYKLVKKN